MSREYDETWKLLHPELLPLEDLINILHKKQVDIEEQWMNDKAKLVELVRRIAMPRCQRQQFQSNPVKQPEENLVVMRSPEKGQTEKVECVRNSLSRISLKRPASSFADPGSNSSQQSSPTIKKNKREPITWP